MFGSGLVNTAVSQVDGAIDFAEGVAQFFGAAPEVEEAISEALDRNANSTAAMNEFFRQFGK